MNPIQRPKRQFLIPQYDELVLFMMSSSILALFILDDQLRQESLDFIRDDKWDPRIYLAVAIFGFGLFLPIRHIFTHRPKSDTEKGCMLYFAVFVNGLSGIAAGVHAFNDGDIDLWIVFPLWNIISGALLLIFYRIDAITEETSIIDDNTTIPQAMTGLLIVTIIIGFSHLVFQQYWALTFSICVACASSLSGLIERIPALKGSE